MPEDIYYIYTLYIWLSSMTIRSILLDTSLLPVFGDRQLKELCVNQQFASVPVAGRQHFREGQIPYPLVIKRGNGKFLTPPSIEIFSACTFLFLFLRWTVKQRETVGFSRGKGRLHRWHRPKYLSQTPEALQLFALPDRRSSRRSHGVAVVDFSSPTVFLGRGRAVWCVFRRSCGEK